MRRLPALLLLVSAALGAAELVNTNAADAERAPEVAESELVKISITVRNPHDREMQVAPFVPPCSCTEVMFSSMIMPPHGSTTLAMTVGSKNLSGLQRIPMSVALVEPGLDAIGITALWKVRAHVQVDLLPSPNADPLARPERAFQDRYRFSSKARPQEVKNLHKRIRLSCPAGEAPEGGLRVTGIEYQGQLWIFTPTVQSDGSVLIDARGRDGLTLIDKRHYNEELVVFTNHPKKARISLGFFTYVGGDAGEIGSDPATRRKQEGP